MENNGKAAAAFLFGIIVGGIAGLIFAPKPGRETRGYMQQYMKETEEKLNKKKDELKKKADDLKKRFDKALQTEDENSGDAEKS